MARQRASSASAVSSGPVRALKRVHVSGLQAADRQHGRTRGPSVGCEPDNLAAGIESASVLLVPVPVKHHRGLGLIDGGLQQRLHGVGLVLEIWGYGDGGELHGRAVVGHHRDGVQLAGVGVDAVLDEAAAQQRLGLSLGGVESGAQVRRCLRRRHRAGQRHLGDVVDDAAELPGPLGAGLELGEPARRGTGLGPSLEWIVTISGFRRSGQVSEISWWAFTWAGGGWKVLAFFGVVLSVVAAVIVIAVFVLRVLVENSDLMDGNSKPRKSRKSGGRRGRRRR